MGALASYQGFKPVHEAPGSGCRRTVYALIELYGLRATSLPLTKDYHYPLSYRQWIL